MSINLDILIGVLNGLLSVNGKSDRANAFLDMSRTSEQDIWKSVHRILNSVTQNCSN